MEWIPKQEAARLAGISPRQLERREAQGYIEKRVAPRSPMQRTAPVLYSRADILALKAGTPNIHAREVEEDRPNSPTPAADSSTALAVSNDTGVSERPGLARRADPLAEIAAHLARIASQPAVDAAIHPYSEKPWIPLSEAVEYSGLSSAFLLRKAREGVPWAVDVGAGRKAFWRFNRAALKQGAL